MEDRNEPGEVDSGSNMVAIKKGGGCSRGSTLAVECLTPEQAVVRSEASTMAMED